MYNLEDGRLGLSIIVLVVGLTPRMQGESAPLHKSGQARSGRLGASWGLDLVTAPDQIRLGDAGTPSAVAGPAL
jgi:hypothetical protein